MSSEIETLRDRTSTGAYLILFGAKWAPPSLALDKELRKSDLEGAKYAYIDVEEHSAYADFHNVVTIPTIISLYQGRELERKLGALSLTDAISMARVVYGYSLKHNG
jgi:thioredoxin-like negative regulator of GroEL